MECKRLGSRLGPLPVLVNLFKFDGKTKRAEGT